MDKKLDRLIEFDDRSLNYPIKSVLRERKIYNPRSYTWFCPTWLDQGQQGACVGFAFSHELSARPKMIPNITNDSAIALYKEAQKVDQWPGENYDGTSVLAGIKALQASYPGKIEEYRWAFTLEDLILTLGYFGPCILGINWYDGMYYPDEEGVIKVSGHVVGGHAILARGVNIKKRLIRLRNSWGHEWGEEGDCFISFDDMALLQKQSGEVCVPVSRGF